MAGGTVRHETGAERTVEPSHAGDHNGQPHPVTPASRPFGGRARVRHAGATPPFEPSLAQVLLVAALGAAAAAIVLALARGAAGDAVVAPVVTACVRAASYIGLVMAAGSTAFVTVVWPRGRTDRRLALMVWFGWLTIGATAVLHLAIHEGAALLVPGGDRVAIALGARLGILLLSVSWVAAALRGRPSSRLVGLALFLGLTSTWVYAGPVSPGVVTVVVTVIHIAAACLWVGGLAVLAMVLLPLGRTAALARTLPRFSHLATACVVVLAASGTLHAVSRAGSVANLFDTTYGRVVWLKVAAVGAMLAVANGNRRYVLRHVRRQAARPSGEPVAVGATRHAANGAPDPDGTHTNGGDGMAPGAHHVPPLQMLGLFLGAEIAFGALVMVLTAVLVAAPVG